MNHVTVEDWVGALRSGKYTKGRGKLHNETVCTWCCLGVLMRLVGMKPIPCKGMELPPIEIVDYLSGLDTSCIDEAYSPDGLFNLVTKSGRQLSCFNDDDQSENFKDVADFIEENFSLRFKDLKGRCPNITVNTNLLGQQIVDRAAINDYWASRFSRNLTKRGRIVCDLLSSGI